MPATHPDNKKPKLSPPYCIKNLPDFTECIKKKEIKNQFNPANVFINIPYSKRYKPFEHAISFVLFCYDLNPIIVREEDIGSMRICEICKAILKSKYGISDLWFTTKNVPFELALMLAFGRFNIILHENRRKAYIQLSDNQYLDAVSHGGNTATLIKKLSERIPKVISESSSEKISLPILLKAFNDYRNLVRKKGFDSRNAAIYIREILRMRKDPTIRGTMIKSYIRSRN